MKRFRYKKVLWAVVSALAGGAALWALDQDGGGISDVWETHWSTGPLNATEDPDADGYSNLIEYYFNTNPLDPQSRPRVVIDWPEPIDIQVSFFAPMGQQFEIEQCDDLLTGNWTSLTGLQTGSGAPLVYSEDPTGMEMHFFRVVPHGAIDSESDGLDAFEEGMLGSSDNSTDSDGDGLTDAQEIGLGTDPANPDTDGDRLGDGFEIQYQSFGFNPTEPPSDTDLDADADPDVDGLCNQEEEEASTDPMNPDTDGDGVIDGLDGWATDPVIRVPRLPKVSYAVIPLQDAVTDPDQEFWAMKLANNLMAVGEADNHLARWNNGTISFLEEIDYDQITWWDTNNHGDVLLMSPLTTRIWQGDNTTVEIQITLDQMRQLGNIAVDMPALFEQAKETRVDHYTGLIESYQEDIQTLQAELAQEHDPIKIAGLLQRIEELQQALTEAQQRKSYVESINYQGLDGSCSSYQDDSHLYLYHFDDTGNAYGEMYFDRTYYFTNNLSVRLEGDTDVRRWSDGTLDQYPDNKSQSLYVAIDDMGQWAITYDWNPIDKSLVYCSKDGTVCITSVSVYTEEEGYSYTSYFNDLPLTLPSGSSLYLNLSTLLLGGTSGNSTIPCLGRMLDYEIASLLLYDEATGQWNESTSGPFDQLYQISRRLELVTDNGLYRNGKKYSPELEGGYTANDYTAVTDTSGIYLADVTSSSNQTAQPIPAFLLPVDIDTDDPKQSANKGPWIFPWEWGTEALGIALSPDEFINGIGPSLVYYETVQDAEADEEEAIKMALTIYHKDVRDEIGQVQDFNIHFKVGDGTIDGISWTKQNFIKTPGEGSPPDPPDLQNPNTSHATLANLTQGGVYRYDLNAFGEKTAIQVWLPTAGPDISSYWQDEIGYFKNTWGPAYRTKLNAPLLIRFSPALKRNRMVQDLFEIGTHADWEQPSPSIKGTKSPSGLANIAPDSWAAGDKDRFTMYAYVIDFAKRNNMMYALIAREMGFTEFEILYGPDLAVELKPIRDGAAAKLQEWGIPTDWIPDWNAGSKDTEAAREAYKAGFDIFDGTSLENVMQAHGIKMQEPAGRAAKEWPSLETTTQGLVRKPELQTVLQRVIQ